MIHLSLLNSNFIQFLVDFSLARLVARVKKKRYFVDLTSAITFVIVTIYLELRVDIAFKACV